MAEDKTIKLSGKQIVDGLTTEKMRLETVQRNIASIQNLLQEIFFAKESLKSIKKAKKGENTIISLGAGIFLDMKISETTKVKRIIAGNIMLDSKADKALEELEKQEKTTTEKLEELDRQQQSIYANINTLSRILTQAQKARQQETGKTD